MTLALGCLFVAAANQDPEPVRPELWYEAVVGGLGCAAVLVLRRRRPVAVAVGTTLGGAMSAALTGAFPVTAFNVALNRPWRVSGAVALFQAGWLALTFRLAEPDTGRYVETIVPILLLLAVVVAVGMLVRSQRELMASLQERARQAEAGQRMRVEEARHLERERLAREMHDVLAHRISIIAIHAGALEVRPGAGPDEVRAAGIVRQNAYEALEDLREVIGVLRGRPRDAGAPPERPQPTLADLPDLVDQARRTGTSVDLDQGGDLSLVPARVGRHAYRIVQEGLTNARKHAPGAPVAVRVRAEDDGLHLDIVNRLPAGTTGTGIPGAGAGLLGLRERVELVGGRIEHGRVEGGRIDDGRMEDRRVARRRAEDRRAEDRRAEDGRGEHGRAEHGRAGRGTTGHGGDFRLRVWLPWRG